MRATHRNQQRPPHRLGTFVAIAVAIVLGISATGVAVFGLAATATVAYLSEDLPDPSRARVADVRPADDPLRPRGRGRTGPFPDRRAAGHRLRRRAPAGSRRDDHRGGPHVLGERRLRRAGDPVRDRRERKRRERARGIDDHPAARPRADAASGGGGARLRPVRPQGQGDPPVDAPQRDISRRRRQGTGHHRVPQRDLLRAQGVRDRRRGRGLLRGRGSGQPDAGAGGTARRAPQVAEHPRSVCLRRGEQGRRPGRPR